MHWVGFGASVYHLEGGGDASDNLSNFLNLKFKRRKSPIHKDILVLTLSQYSGSLKGILITRADLLGFSFLLIKSFKTAFEKKILCLIYRSIKRMKQIPYLGNLISYIHCYVEANENKKVPSNFGNWSKCQNQAKMCWKKNGATVAWEKYQKLSLLSMFSDKAPKERSPQFVQQRDDNFCQITFYFLGSNISLCSTEGNIKFIITNNLISNNLYNVVWCF